MYMKRAKDHITATKKEIATLDSFVSVSGDEQTKLAEQEEQMTKLLEKFNKDLKGVLNSSSSIALYLKFGSGNFII